jgi:D-2-hydroxyacid dehydrogenase (NADP+)
MTLSTFAFLHPVEDEMLRAFRAALPSVEFLVPQGKELPKGLERAEGASLSWAGPAMDTVLARARKLTWIHHRGAGIEKVAGASLLARGVTMTNGSGNHAPNMAEHVLGLMLAFARGLPALIRAQQESRWDPPGFDAVFELTGQRLAIVGLGAIGEALAVRAAAFGMTVVGVRRSGAPSELPPGVAAVYPTDRLNLALATADHVAAILPLTAETQNIFDAGRFAAMKRGAYFYNVGRGGLVDQSALLAALRSGHLAGAGLDVTEPEPLPADSPLWLEPRVVITAHSAGATPKSDERYRTLLIDNLRRFAAGQPLRNVVDLKLGY